MNKVLEISFWQSTYTEVADWLMLHLISFAGLYHLLLLIAAFLIGAVIAIPIRKFIRRMYAVQKHWSFFDFAKGHERYILPLFFLINCVMAKEVANHFNWQSPILNIASSLLSAWFVIKIFELVIQNEFWQKPVSWVVWIIAILNSLQLYNAVEKLLKSVNIDLGKLNLSLFDIIRAGLSIGISLWLALKISGMLSKKIATSKGINPTARVLFSKLTKLILVSFSVIIALQMIGISLSNLALFTGAIGVGIGFGMQKIISNLFSGILLLLDKSVKPGDVIEIDGKIGWIKSLSARFVSIQTLGGREVLIPNEDLVTQKVINWSFSTRLIRLDIDVGVDYKTDLDFAIEVIKQAVEQVERVIKRPATKVIVKDFADSAIILQVWAWISDPEKGIENVKSDIRLEIWRCLKTNNIGIPFPQRDVHIKK